MMQKTVIRCISTFLFISLLCTVFTGTVFANDSVKIGDIIILGAYEQDNNLNNGEEPIEWEVISVEGSKALVISTVVLDYKPYNDVKGNITWEESSLRAWLNDGFLTSAFTESEAAVIIAADIPNGSGQQPEKEKWEGEGGKDTNDKIWLLSTAEVQQYLNTAEVTDTDYANTQGSLADIFGTIFSESVGWYTRSVGKKQDQAAFMHKSFEPESVKVETVKGIRPVLWIDTAADRSGFPYELSFEVDNLIEQGNLTEAYELCDSLGTYWNSQERSAEIRFTMAVNAMNAENYEEAVGLFGTYYNFISELPLAVAPEYVVNLPECYYQLAKESIAAGDYKQAIAIISEMGQYKDSVDMLLRCFDKTHTQYYWLTKNKGSAVNAGSKGYSENKALEVDDPNYGWNLGRFLISGFTEVDESNGVPVFIKTPGDNLTVWFVLEQDIDALNNNSELSIAEDAKGYDTRMNTVPTNLGRGALFFTHTDFRNSDSNPIMYVDYLSATRTGVANTHVEIKEEGIYEAALDYKIHDSNIKHFLSADQYYRIAFEFNVKNGSAMFFMFDVSTRGELDDYSITSDGFRIDLANSHSLKLDVVRYAVNQSGTGLDIRFNAPASDGDEFTKTGYYEITIENSETGEKMTKHIFVGDSSELAQYIEVSPELSAFNK